MPIRTIAPSDRGARFNTSYARTVVDLGCGIGTFEWSGYATVPAGSSIATTLDIIIPYQDGKGGQDTVGMVLHPNSFITKVGVRALGALVLGSPTGKLKFASSLTAATATQYVETPAATAFVLNAQAVMANTLNGFGTAASMGSSEVTFRLYATDGGSGAATVASTVQGKDGKEVKVLVTIAGYTFLSDPSELDVGFSLPKAR